MGSPYGAIHSTLYTTVLLLAAAIPPGSAHAQEIRIFGISYPEGSRRPSADQPMEIPLRLTPDERYARFPLTVSVRNYRSTAAQYQLHLRLESRGRVSRSPSLDVAPGSVRREPYDITIDFGQYWDAPEPTPGTSFPAPTAILLPPSNPVRATLRLLSESGAVLDSQSFNLILSQPPSPPRRATDLAMEKVEFVSRSGSMYARLVFRNVGRQTWGFRGDASAHLQAGTPETRLDDIGAEGMPTMPRADLPGGLEVNDVDSVMLRLETRLMRTGPIGGGRLMRVTPPLRPGQWYTLTGWTSSEADLDPSNDSVRLIFMLGEDMTIRESRWTRVTNRVRVLTR